MSASPVARVGDSGSHGGAISSGSANRTVDGRACARVGDTYSCPIHGDNPITGGSAIATDDGKRIARVGDGTACGASISSGSPTWSSE